MDATAPATTAIQPERRVISIYEATSGGYVINVSISGGVGGYRDETHLFYDKTRMADFINKTLDT